MSQQYDLDSPPSRPLLADAWIGVRLESGESMTDYMKGRKTDYGTSVADAASSKMDCASTTMDKSDVHIHHGLSLRDCAETHYFICQLGKKQKEYVA